ncbi:MAG: translocation/assembly module TamB domain-containing protein [Paraprevotella sp.]|nr:translocation/assembly module TamB domain-containing protein [Paraprevotella sp.]
MKKKIFKWIVGILFTPIILFLIVAALLYIPPIQDFAVRKATVYLSDATGMKFHIGRLRLTFLFDIDLQNVEISDAQNDPLLNVERLAVDLSLTSLLHGQVDVEGIELDQATVNTKSFITGMELKGHIGRFFLDAHSVEIPQEMVQVDNALLSDADIAIALNDSTAPKDTTTSVVNWKIALHKVGLDRIRFRLSMPGDSMKVSACLSNATLQEGFVDLGNSAYTAKSIDLHADSLFYDLPYKEKVAGLDFNHIALCQVGLGIDSVRFDGQSLGLSLALRDTRMKEKSGLNIDSLSGTFHMDSTSLHLPALTLHTPDSYVRLQADMDMSAVATRPQGKMSARLMGELGKQDILLMAGGLPRDFVKAYPNAPIVLRLSADGNMDAMQLTTAEVKLAQAFDMKAHGTLRHLTDSANLTADVDVDMNTRNLNFVRALAGKEAMKDIALPPMHIDGKVGMQGQRYTADLRLRESKGNVRVKARLDAARMDYQARLDVKDLQIHHFLPKDSIYGLTVVAEAQGKGTDLFSRRTLMQADVALKRLQYGHFDLGNITVAARLRDGKGRVDFGSHNALLEMNSQVEALMSRHDMDMNFSMDMKSIDLHALQLTAKPFKAGMSLHMDGSTNLKNKHALHGTVTDIALIVQDTVFHPKDLAMHILAHPDTTYADISAGDFKLLLDGRDGYETLMKRGKELMALVDKQMQRRHLNQDSLKFFLPRMTLSVSSGKDNPVSSYLTASGYSFDEFRLSLNADPETGLNGGGHVYALQTGSVLLDTVQIHIFQDSTGVKMDGRVRNGPENKQFVFESQINAYLHSTGAGINLVYLDEQRKKGVDIGLRADVLDNGLKVVFSQTHPIIAYRKFQINPDNYIFLGNDRRVEADVDMVADDSTEAKVYSTPNPDALQDISVTLNHVNLGELMSVIPYAPNITGNLQTDAHLIKTTENISVVADVSVQNMAYEGISLGNIELGTVYLPNNDGTHFIDTRVLHNDEEVMNLSGSYKESENTGILKANLNLTDFPLSLANGFIPDKMANLDGKANGSLQVEGSTSHPEIDGWLSMTNMKMAAPEYSLNLRMADDTIEVKKNRLSLNELNLYSTGKNPLVLNGTVDFSNFENVKFNLQMDATNFELINAKRTVQASAYGKVNVDLHARMSGNLNNINIGGRVGVLGNTDVTYTLKNTALSSEDRLSGIVTFVDFSDTTVVEKEETPPMNLNVTMQVSIDQGAQVHCLLSDDRSKYVDLEGGGDLTMIYTPMGELTLTGRYTVQSGEMKYSLPVIPLKTFTIASGSYVDFNGPIMNPTLHISATERVRSTVTENNTPRTVSFDVGLSISRTLENMGLEFTIAAPEDMSIQNQIASMSTEERGKVAVAMLATGMYIMSDNNNEGFSTSNALNSLLQSEITHIAGKALETIDMSLGVDQETTAEGTERTDYSFRFAKRFWGNRVSIIIGGKVSTGENVENTGQSLIDNISLEYRLDKSSTRYVTLFYDKNYESLLEGEITEMGAGLVLRRKMTRLGELFIFRNKKKEATQTANEKK